MKKTLCIILLLFMLSSCTPNNTVSSHQKQNIDRLVFALSEGKIRYNFNGLEDIVPDNLNMYLSQRYSAFFDENEVALDDRMSGYLTYKQAMTILKADFGETDTSFIKPETLFFVQGGVQGKGGNVIKLSCSGNIIIAEVEYEFFPSPLIEHADKSINYVVEYKFKTINDKTIHIISGKIL